MCGTGNVKRDVVARERTVAIAKKHCDDPRWHVVLRFPCWMLGLSTFGGSVDVDAVAAVLKVVAVCAETEDALSSKSIKPRLFALCLQIASDAGGGTVVMNCLSGLIRELLFLGNADITDVEIGALAKALPLASTQQLASTSPKKLILNGNPFGNDGFHRLIVGMGKMEVPITYLSVGRCQSITTVPTEINQLTSLEELDLSFCRSLISLPEEIGGLTSLKRLDLSDCTSLISLPEEIGELKLLKFLFLKRCTSLKGSDAVISALKKNDSKVFHD